MAQRVLYLRSTTWKFNEILPVLLPIRSRSQTQHKGRDPDEKFSRIYPTHAISTAEYIIGESPKWVKAMEQGSAYTQLWDIRKESGAVVRHEDMANKARVKDEEMSGKLLIVGDLAQMQLAFNLLNSKFDLRSLFSSPCQKFTRKNDDSNPYTPFNPQNFYKKMWQSYRRNFKGQYAPLKPRQSCVRPARDQYAPKGQCGNPCALCQMIYLYGYHVHFTDIEILGHFMCPHTGDIFPTTRTNICNEQHLTLEAHVEKARLHGYLPFRLPVPSVERELVMHKRGGLPTDRSVKVVRNRSWNYKLYRSPKNQNKSFKF